MALMLFRIDRKNITVISYNLILNSILNPNKPGKTLMSHGHMTKLRLWPDKQNDVSQSEDALHSKLNYCFIEFWFIRNKKNDILSPIFFQWTSVVVYSLTGLLFL